MHGLNPRVHSNRRGLSPTRIEPKTLFLTAIQTEPKLAKPKTKQTTHYEPHHSQAKTSTNQHYSRQEFEVLTLLLPGRVGLVDLEPGDFSFASELGQEVPESFDGRDMDMVVAAEAAGKFHDRRHQPVHLIYQGRQGVVVDGGVMVPRQMYSAQVLSQLRWWRTSDGPSSTVRVEWACPPAAILCYSQSENKVGRTARTRPPMP